MIKSEYESDGLELNSSDKAKRTENWRMATLKRKRDYKKDTIYLKDLYTLTFDENETLESLGEIVSH